MNSDRIANRITDLLKLTGVSDGRAIEELTDHYLTHIDEEIKRGVNAQQAIRETFQEIAHLDVSLFKEKQEPINYRGLFLILLIFLAAAFFFFYQNKNKPIEKPSQDISIISAPTGSPILQSALEISSEFGMRSHPIYKQKELHKGIDIRAKFGTPVLSTGDGIVMDTGFKSKSGNYITIQHNDDYSTQYYHLSDIFVNSCELVKVGQIIGKVGNSGLSMMPHLHYEVLKNKVPVNPRGYIEP